MLQSRFISWKLLVVPPVTVTTSHSTTLCWSRAAARAGYTISFLLHLCFRGPIMYTKLLTVSSLNFLLCVCWWCISACLVKMLAQCLSGFHFITTIALLCNRLLDLIFTLLFLKDLVLWYHTAASPPLTWSCQECLFHTVLHDKSVCCCMPHQTGQ